MKNQTIERIRHQKRIFCNINSVRALCELLKIEQRKLELIAQQPQYKTFTIPKKGGGKRLIEAPDKTHKIILGRLNTFLQSVYFFEKSNAAYGFILGVKNDNDRRNVVVNARKHRNKKYMVNIDLKDFFHSVTTEQVVKIFSEKPFSFKRGLPILLAELTTYNGRLPMGTSTSPVLSNLACRQLDDDLIQLSKSMLWTFTRYADDMTFSSNRLINAQMIQTITDTINKHHFTVNFRKVKRFGPDDPKIVTGLLVTEKVSLAPNYFPALREELQRLKDVFIAQNEQGQLSTKWAEDFKLQVRGRLNFAGFVMGKNHKQYQDLKDFFYEAINPPQEEFNAISWRGFPYNF